MGTLEKVIKENGVISTPAVLKWESCLSMEKLRVCAQNTCAVHLAEDVIYSGMVWNLYGAMISAQQTTKKRRQ